MKKILAIALVLCMVMALAACGGSSAPAASTPAPAQSSAATTTPAAPAAAEMPSYSFKFSLTQSNTDPIVKFAQMMVDEIQEKTDGHITIELHPNGELGAINDVNEMIAQGGELINYTGCDAFNATVPNLAILKCQYCLSDPDQMTKVMNGDWYKEQVETLAANGNVRLLTYNWFTGFRHFATKFDVKSVDDMAGKNMRVADAAALIAFSKALGCAPVVTTWNETYTGLSNGMLDCCESPIASLWASSIQEVTDYIVLTKHLVSTGGLCMNESIFASMPAEYQQIILDAAYNAGEAFKEDSLAGEEGALQNFIDAGKTIVRLDEAALKGFREKASAMYKDPSLGFPEGLYESIQETISK